MRTHSPIPDVGPLSDAKRKLIDNYLRNDGFQASGGQQRIPRRPTGEPVPLSSPQQQVWVHSQMAGSIPIYNEAFTVCRRGPLDVVVLERCLTEILRRHEIWRTTFDAVNGKPIQVVQAASERFPLKTIDLRHLSLPERIPEALCSAAEDARKPFDLQKGPLLRATLVRMEDEEYRLHVTLHQIVFDAASAYRVFLPELAALYEALSAGKPSPLPEPILQYGDFAYWQQKNLASGAWSEQLSFWRQKLSGELPVLPWPNDHPRPAYQTHRGAVERFEFDSGLIARLKTFCRQECVSSYMTLLASYAALLGRYTGQQDIVIGGLSAGRRRSEVEGVLGYFVNPLALRVDVSGNPTFRELTKQVLNTVLDALANDEVPFENVVEALQLRPDPSRNPIFQLILSQQPQMPAVPGWDLVTEEVSNGGSKLDMTIVLDERSHSVSGPITYNPDVFDRSTITRMVGHWQTLLAGALARPDSGIAELPLLTGPERQQILTDWNITQVDYPRDKCLHELFEAQAVRTPDAVALNFGDNQMTYSELHSRSTQLSRSLQSLGVGPDVPTGLYLERSFDMIVGLLAVLEAGGVCLPLDPTYPKDRLAFMLAETQAPVLLTQARLASDLPPHNAKVLCLDLESQPQSTEASAVAYRPLSPDNLAYIIYTSGSTGRPKGVQVTHGGLVNSTLARSTYYRDPVSSFLLLPSFAFDSSLAGIFWTLSTGGRLILPPDHARCDLAALVELIVEHRISHLLCVPSLYRQLLDQANLERIRSLSVAIVAGEECSKELVELHYRLLPRTALFNEYGPTEATVWSSVHRCELKTRSSRVPIGRPIANTRLYVLDSRLEPAPVGIPGELHIAGPGVTRGYLQRPELNAGRFIPDPFDSESRSCLYKTGDLVRYLPDGNIEYLGRLDDQVKIRGFRIEIGEIEAALCDCPGVHAAVVTVREDLPGDKRLVAYVAPVSRRELTAAGLRALLKDTLPEYMVPSAFVFLETLPVSSNGKVDRRALPAPNQTDGAHAPGFLPPRDAVEIRLTKIWEEILGIRNIGIERNLFELGAHSLLVTRLLTRIEREFGRRLTFASVFAAPTIEQLATLLRHSSPPSSHTQLLPIQLAGSKPPFFSIGAGFLFRSLSEHLGTEQPLLGVQFDASIVDQLHLPYTVEELAGYMTQAIREQQSNGPYFLGGFCDNGMIAYETARQLIDQGHQVALLAIFDARNHAYYRHNSNEGRSSMSWKHIPLHFERLRQLKTADACRYLGMRLKELWQTGRRNAAARLAEICGRGSGERIRDLERIVILAQQRYEPKPYPGRVALFRADTKSDEDLSGWAAVINGPVDVQEIPGTHMGIFFDPHVKHLANRFAACLDEANDLVTRGKR
jgi:surfactin family lipopeptide synthetase A